MISRLHCSSHSNEQESPDRWWGVYTLQKVQIVFIGRNFSENVFGSPRLNYVGVCEKKEHTQVIKSRWRFNWRGVDNVESWRRIIHNKNASFSFCRFEVNSNAYAEDE